jgi:spore germination cell wall hydrolase CwlJ-like protein
MPSLATIEKRLGMSHQDARWIGVVLITCLVILVILLLRLLPPPLRSSLDAGIRPIQAMPANATFPGSAYLLAEGAFRPAPGSVALDGPHVLRLSDSPAAPATRFRAFSAVDGFRAANCLAAAIYYEAGNEPEEGQRAVAQVVLNRVRNPAFPRSVCAVVYQGSERTDLKCQFSFACDGAMARMPDAQGWGRARRIAVEALAGTVFPSVGLSTWYHTLAVKPDWSDRLQPVAVVGAHIFYRDRGPAGLPTTFHARYSGLEMQSGPAFRPVAAPDASSGPPASLPLPAFPPIGEPVRSAPIEGISNLPKSEIRAEYRSSGRPLEEPKQH